MTMSLTTPVTGGAQTGFTAPTYTLVADTPPKLNAKQWYVSALGGTQVGVNVHSASSPFTVTVEGPVSFQPPPIVTANGLTKPVAMNRYVLRVRKGASVTSANDKRVSMFEGVFLCPAGADLNAAAELRGLASMVIGALNQISAGVGDTLVSGTA